MATSPVLLDFPEFGAKCPQLLIESVPLQSIGAAYPAQATVPPSARCFSPFPRWRTDAKGLSLRCAEFLPRRNRGLGPLAVTVLLIPFARRAAATPCAAVT